MTNTITIPTRATTVIGTTEIKLPFYFTSGDWTKIYCCMNENYVLVTVYANGSSIQIESKQYEDEHEVSFRLERESRDKHYAAIDQSVFMHKFSEAHRQIFYVANPQLKPIE
jgi:hypothetical protein